MKKKLKAMLAGMGLGVAVMAGCSEGGPALAQQLDESDFAAAEPALGEGVVTGSGISFDLGTTRVQPDSGTKTVKITNVNGTIDITQGSGKNLEIHTEVVVKNLGKEEAKAVAEQAGLNVEEGTVLSLEAYSEPYTAGAIHGNPSIHLTITLPKGLGSGLEAKLTNGNIDLSQVTGTGTIELETVNGSVSVQQVDSAVILETNNGEISVSDAKGKVRASLVNGSIDAERIGGELELEATNGNLSVEEAASSIEAHTVTGNVEVESAKVGGDWTVSTTVGDVDLRLPEKADVEVDGKTMFAKPKTDLPLTVSLNRITGKLGKGTYLIDAGSMAGLSLKKMG
ncbi:DUF4097 family beta strand repeat-containing protein [Paenibacillus tengchongensis]|uniref:DUF4097 family beta strand repeat-containing protein n=1 Tax=Paenibacillus tengchongensis TaxID=2608684 RepID=UPI00124EA854|nr:DUF4097 family beta strand repeat-containing protein [Paenibacillus tengchongensis]